MQRQHLYFPRNKSTTKEQAYNNTATNLLLRGSLSQDGENLAEEPHKRQETIYHPFKYSSERHCWLDFPFRHAMPSPIMLVTQSLLENSLGKLAND